MRSGVMIRAGADPQAPYYGVFLTPSNGVAVQWRASQAAQTNQVLESGVTAPQWVMAARYTDTTRNVVYYSGKPVTLANGWNGDPNFNIQHTFAIPGINLSVPVQAGPGTCLTGPCTNKQHSTTTFSFMTPAPGVYRWQCFIPCGLDFLNGNGGPMQTIGYMMGNMQVVS